MKPSLRCYQSLAQRSKTTSFIGLGRMGYEMATNLFSKQYAASKDAHFVVCDVVPEASQSFRDVFIKKYPGANITIADSPQEAAINAGTIVTMLPSSPQVKDVYYNRIIPALASLPRAAAQETLCIDSTTLDVDVARAVANDVTSKGSKMVDAPVSGGVTGAKAGTLSFLVGGPEASFNTARPILALMGHRIIHCGDSGAGLGAKICNNLILGVQQIVVAEAMLLGQKLGLDPAVLASVVNSSTGACWSSSVNNPVPSALPDKAPPCEKNYEGGFATALMLKDMGLATDIAEKQNSSLPLGRAARDIYGRVAEEKTGLGRKDFSSYVRIVDKYSVHPATTYLGSEFPKILEKPQVEYKQANLTVEAAITSAFEPPEGHAAFEYVYDFTGEVRADRTEVIQYTTTFGVARMLGLEAARRGVKAYVRIQQPFYETSSKGSLETDNPKPAGTLGTWWHETLRGLAAIEDLNLVVLRVGLVYGPYTPYGIIATGINVASIYGYMKRPMKSMWSPGKNANNTIHIDDVAAAAWAASLWIAKTGRKAANDAAGVPIQFHNDKSFVKEHPDIPPPTQTPVAPLFNLTDDSNNTLVSVGDLVTSFFGTSFEFFNLVESTVLKLMDDMEDINEHHVSGWTEMLQNSEPPITNTPLTGYMDKYALDKHVVAFPNTKIKEVLGYQLKYPKFSHEAIKEIVDKWKAEGSWPIVG
ncbi:hypothetical protein EST38_g929 [Candolleomyces aberdarensis]|uniref:3-hydroxyisobutyrate dehydrogenase n=1 Tax=Candolleomyces aberdarensis TaxID=2316362 RepID=A0A4Q2DWP4_9AGAR|nr:hypothetical protein EST38_g929 [Candolleomyces aberdarensis]